MYGSREASKWIKVHEIGSKLELLIDSDCLNSRIHGCEIKFLEDNS